jgi:HNH endonuclease
LSSSDVHKWAVAYLANGNDLYLPDGHTIDAYQVDHVIPDSLGGIDHPYNYVLTPRAVNRYAHVRPVALQCSTPIT